MAHGLEDDYFRTLLRLNHGMMFYDMFPEGNMAEGNMEDLFQQMAIHDPHGNPGDLGQDLNPVQINPVVNGEENSENSTAGDNDQAQEDSDDSVDNGQDGNIEEGLENNADHGEDIFDEEPVENGNLDESD